MVSLLSKPTTLDIDYFLAYKLFCAENKIVVVVENENEDKERRERDIDETVADIAGNSRVISAQLKEKTGVFAKIQASMDLLRYAKVSLDERQMNGFAAFMQSSEKESRALSAALQRIDECKDLNTVKNELLHNDADYDLIVHELKEISAFQQEALASLDAMIEKGNNMLSLL